MLIYWALFLTPIYFIFGKAQGGTRTSQLEWSIYGLSLIILIGLRHQVGGDWVNYLEGLELESAIEWSDLFSKRDPGYTLISWFSIGLGASVYGINLTCSIIFVVGLLNFSRTQPYPWIAILVATPYLVIMVAMGYTRQAAALGFLMYSFKHLMQGRVVSYLTLVLFAGMMHKTAFVFAALLLFRPGSGKLKGILGIGLIVGLIGAAYFVEQAETFVLNYVTYSMESGGAVIRILMNVLPALLLFWSWKKWKLLFADYWLWGLFAILSLACLPIVSLASTAVDRMSLYLIPLQLVVWARFPLVVQGSISRTLAFIMIALYYAAVQFTYLNYGSYVSAWLPYDNLLFHIF